MIPDFQKLMLPLLKILGDGAEHANKDVVTLLGNHFSLTEVEMQEMLPSRNQPVFYNRVTWAIAHFKSAELLHNTRRGFIQITDLGKLVLEGNPEQINLKFLRQLPSYQAAMASWRKSSPSASDAIEIATEEIETPDALLSKGYASLTRTLKIDLLQSLKQVHPARFERIVVDLLVKMGYGGSEAEAARATKYTGDEGIDGIIKEDKLGLDVIYIQAKRWDGTVSRPELQKFVGALAGQRARKGVFITTSTFSREASDYVKKMDVNIVLIDGEQLAQYMIDYNLGVSVQTTYEIKKLDLDYFEEDQ